MPSKTLRALLEEDGELEEERAQGLPNILVVDDEASVRRALQLLLQDRYQVTACASAKEGVAAVHEDTCAVILDVKMQGYDGFWACDEIRKRHPGLPIIFYSAYQNLKDPYRIINEHHPFGYITKDGDAGKLLEAVDSAVRLYKVVLQQKGLTRRPAREQGAGG